MKKAEDRTLDAMDALVFKALGPRGRGSEVKDSDLASASSHELQAESGTNESEPAGHYEGIPLYAFILAQVHFLCSLCSLWTVSPRSPQRYALQTTKK